jgi:large subunit ribosomal protein L4e
VVFFMKASVLGLDGKKLHDLELPSHFEADVDKGLIKRAVLSMQSNARQPKGSFPRAGRENTAKYIGRRSMPTRERGINVGRARLPRLNNRRGRLMGRVASIPRAVGGPKAHPPKAEAKRTEKINRKERRAALASAISACTKQELVSERHVLEKGMGLPLVVEEKFEGVDKTKKLKEVFRALNILPDLENAEKKTRRRAGKGKKRGRKKKQKKSVLIVTGKTSPVFKAARNLPGVDVCTARNLNAELLAPGAVPGRLVVWSEPAVNSLGKKGAEEK